MTLYGPDYSAYARIARLALEEKGVAYDLVDVDFAGGGGMPAEHLARHPFAKVPVLVHGGRSIYETLAIEVYVDRVFPGPSLQPDDPVALARMFQIIGVIDSYLAYPLREQLVSERLFREPFGEVPDGSVVVASLPAITRSLDAIEALAAGPFLAGVGLSLGDLHAIPMLDYLLMCPEGAPLIEARPGIAAWWRGVAGRSSVVRTRPDLSRIGA